MTRELELWINYNLSLRDKILKVENGVNKYLLTNFSGTLQAADIKQRTPLINDFCRKKINIKAWSDAERAKKGLPPFDFSDNEAVWRALRDEFDMPYWAFRSLSVPLKDLTNTFIYQNKACNVHCPWCYVDDLSKNAKATGGGFFSVKEIMDMFEKLRKEEKIYNFRPSGGETTIVIEQWLEVLCEIEKRKLTAYVQADTNLTTGHYIEYLEISGLIDDQHLIGEFHNFGLLCSFKGTDTESFLKAIGMPKKYAFLEDERWFTFRKFVNAKIDVYPFIYDPNPATLEQFMEKGARLFGDGFCLKTWVVPLKLYGPEKRRLEKAGIDGVSYQKELDDNFKKSENIIQELIVKKFGVNYKMTPRAGILLKTK